MPPSPAGHPAAALRAAPALAALRPAPDEAAWQRLERALLRRDEVLAPLRG
jgi:hypothetical protein